MYNLREINPKMEGMVMNVSLGNRYVIVNKFLQPKEFEKFLQVQKERGDEGVPNADANGIFGYVSFMNGQVIMLWESCHYFIITNEGTTYERIKSHRYEKESLKTYNSKKTDDSNEAVES